jgi:hypothetical protein
MNLSNILLSTFLFLSCQGESMDSKSQELPEQMVINFFDIFSKKGVTESFDYLFSTSEWIKDENDNLKNRITEIHSKMGTFRGFEVISKAKMGESLILYSTLVKYDRQPIRFNFLFYKASSNWQLQDFRFDDELAEELLEATRAYRLKENLPFGNDN